MFIFGTILKLYSLPPKKINYNEVSIFIISMNEEGAIKNVLQDISHLSSGVFIFYTRVSLRLQCDKDSHILKKLT